MIISRKHLGLAFLAIAALAVIAVLGGASATASLGADPPPTLYEVAIDTQPAGNTATSIGPVDNCTGVPNGAMFDIDIILPDLPSPGLAGFGFNILYDSTKLRLVTYDEEMMLAANPSPVIISFSESAPDSDGNLRVDAVDLSGGTVSAETGAGVIVRVTFQAIGLGASVIQVVDTLNVGGVLIVSPTGDQYSLMDVLAAEVNVGGPCPAGILDSDSDAFIDNREGFVGTLAARACPHTAAANDEMDAWPPDFDDNQRVLLNDVTRFGAVFGTDTGDAAYSARYDLSNNGVISLNDVTAIAPYYGQSCTP